MPEVASVSAVSVRYVPSGEMAVDVTLEIALTLTLTLALALARARALTVTLTLTLTLTLTSAGRCWAPRTFLSRPQP